MARATSRATTKSERTRRRIIASYLALLEESDFDKVSVSRICKEAQIVRSTFYVYFDDVYELIQEVEDHALDTLRHADDQSDTAIAFDGARAKTDWGFPIAPPYALAEWVRLCEEEGLALKAMLGPHGDPYFVQKLRRQLEVHMNTMMDRDGMPHDRLRGGFVDALVDAHLALVKGLLLDEESQLTQPVIVTILNTIRVGSNTVGHFATKDNVPSWM